eukprot:6183271-Pleurochrysis_carterae.AAC.1
MALALSASRSTAITCELDAQIDETQAPNTHDGAPGRKWLAVTVLIGRGVARKLTRLGRGSFGTRVFSPGAGLGPAHPRCESRRQMRARSRSQTL